VTRFTCVLFLLLAVSRCGSVARADDAVDLARLSVHEAGWDSLADCDGIAAVLINGGVRTGMTPTAFARVYSPRFAAQTTPRAWVWRLDRRAHDPLLHISWATYRPRWLALIERAGAALAAPPVCAATDWSSPAHMRRRIRDGAALRVIDCGPSLNSFAIRGER
jgi:hypothetical protein